MSAEFLTGFFARYAHGSPDRVREFVPALEQVSVPRNTTFLEAGKVSNTYLVLETGFMRASTIDFNGNEVTTGFFLPGSLVLEPYSFFVRAPSSESFHAITDCTGYAISFEKLNMHFHSNQEFRELGRAILVSEFAAYKKRTLSLINLTAEERYSQLFESSRELFQVAQLKHIASYLGITDTSLSRIRREYSKK